MTSRGNHRQPSSGNSSPVGADVPGAPEPGDAGDAHPDDEAAGATAAGAMPAGVTAADARYMARALELARAAQDQGEVPVGAVLLGPQGEVLAECGNAPIAAHDATAHAEIRVLREAGLALENYRLPGTTLYVTLEPCPMCAGALVQARVARLVFGAADPRTGACGSVIDLPRDKRWNHRIEVVGGVLAGECAELLQSFFAARRQAPATRHTTSKQHRNRQ